MKPKMIVTIALLFVAAFLHAQQYYLLAGTYNSDKSEGIYVYRFNSETGVATEAGHVKVSNPSFLAVSPDESFVYAVEEDADGKGNGGNVSAFSFDKKTGNLLLLNRQPSGGDHPCYITTSKSGKWVVTGNYSSGSLSVFAVQGNGSLAPASTTIRHEGSGPNKARQASPHIHGTFFTADNRFLLVPDLGIDKVMIYRFDEHTGKLTAARQPYAASLAGAGPRHLAFSPNHKFVYLLEELGGTVVAYKYRSGKLKAKQRISSMPAGDSSFAGSADIHVSPDGKFLYASNRAASNTIAIFSIDAQNGKLSPVGHQPVLGTTPRNFNFDPAGNFLLVANQNSDAVVVFKVDKATGLLTDTGNRINTGKPVCLKWITMQ